MKLTVITTIISLVLIGCQTTGVANQSSLPRSTLETPMEIVNGSAIAYQGDSRSCEKVFMSASPILSDGLYGELFEITYEPEIKQKKLFKPLSGVNLNSDELIRLEMPPGIYKIGAVDCLFANGFINSKRNLPIYYGEFTVYSGKTTYLGQFNFEKGLSQRLQISDKSNAARKSFNETYPSNEDAFVVEVVDPTPKMIH